MFQVHLKGVGWTQLDNTVAVTYDNGYVGYGCGFNSQRRRRAEPRRHRRSRART